MVREAKGPSPTALMKLKCRAFSCSTPFAWVQTLISRSDQQWALLMCIVSGSELKFMRDRGTDRERREGGEDEGMEGARDNSEKGRREGGV